MADETLIDRAHLEAQTFGDADLANELVDLFTQQCRRLVPDIADAALPAADRADLAHTLRGSALGIGASRIAARAAETEDALRAGAPSAPGLVDALIRVADDTLAALDGRG